MNKHCSRLAVVAVLGLTPVSGAETPPASEEPVHVPTTPPEPVAEPIPEPTTVADTKFSVDRGFYEAPFSVEISSATQGATIVYTTDGSTPSLSHGESGPSPVSVTITTTTVLRAMAHKDPLSATDVDTQTYLFLTDVIQQPAKVDGYPNPVSWVGATRADPETNKYVVHDYEMDPKIVNHPDYRDEMIPALLAIPTMSIAVEPSALADKRGFYWGEGDALCSMELLFPADPDENTQVDAGVRGHSHDRLKRSLRLNFRAEYGNAKLRTSLIQQGSLHGNSATDTFDRLILRAGNNRTWARIWNPDRTSYTIDQFYRDSQLAVSGLGSRGSFVHLYINGLYWGLYNPVERTDHHFNAEYFGGEAEHWFAVHHGASRTGISGDAARYHTLIDELIKQDLDKPEHYARIQDYVDVENFSDYLLLTWWMGVGDWPSNNWYAGHRTESSPLGATPLRYFAWDGEWSWDASRAGGPGQVHPLFRSHQRRGPKISRIWHALRENKDFMMLFADRAYRHLFNGGPLADEVAQERWQRINAQIHSAVVAESARWGDALKKHRRTTRTRNKDWQKEVDKIHALIDGNRKRFIRNLRRQGFYPDIDPPVFGTGQGPASTTHVVHLTNPNSDGKIYYTVDGADPRMPGGALHESAQVSDGSPISLAQAGTLRARVLKGTTWSALHEATYSARVGEGLRVSEIMYHPVDGDSEYIELMNTGKTEINLSQMSFTRGLSFKFPDHVLAPGKRVVVVGDQDAFVATYGDEPIIVGTYTGALDNGGEKLRLVDATGQTILDLKYQDHWYKKTDGRGHSLVVVNGLQPEDAGKMSAWQASSIVGGTPGR